MRGYSERRSTSSLQRGSIMSPSTLILPIFTVLLVILASLTAPPLQLNMEGRAVVHLASASEDSGSVELGKVLQVRLPRDSIVLWVSVDDDGRAYALYSSGDGRAKLTVAESGGGGFTITIPSPEDADVIEPLKIELEDGVRIYLRARMGALEALYIYRLEGSKAFEEGSIKVGAGYLVYDAVPTPLGLVVGGSKATIKGYWAPFIAVYSYEGGQEALWLLEGVEGRIVSLDYAQPSYVCGLALIEGEDRGVYEYLCIDIAVGAEASRGPVGPTGSGLGSYRVVSLGESCMLVLGPKVLLLGGAGMGVLEELTPSISAIAAAYGGGLAVLAGSRQGSLALEVVGVDSRGCSLEWRALVKASTPPPPVAYIALSPAGRYLAIAYHDGASWSLAVYKVNLVTPGEGVEAQPSPTPGLGALAGFLGSPLLTLTLLALLALLAVAALWLRARTSS